MKISEQSFARLTRRVATKQAWAAYVRRCWPENAISHVQREWDLTDGQARGLVYGHASQPTIDAILRHKRGGAILAIRIEAIAWGVTWEDFIHAAIEQELEDIAYGTRELERAAQRAERARKALSDRRSFTRSGLHEVRQDAINGGSSVGVSGRDVGAG